ncbi:cyclic nucleotide-gated ion channel 1-like [Mercurialis annua]|uniref:cyclic nucleotide-gated ion channel 1-like n=1 Tax=Mercurialis annua TaxID=3986 RepID=UPI002160D7BC|nr:cyclic nucleotide-gated ion channel 1-like [Mercurialis annua]
MKGNKFVRFQDWSSDKSFTSDKGSVYSSDDGFYARKVKPTISAVRDSIHRSWETGYERIKSMRRPSSLIRISSNLQQQQQPENQEPCSKKKILDPQGQFLQKWNKIFVIACFIAVSLDPLFFYIPVIDGEKKCLDLDKKLEIIACVLRTFIDLFYLLHIIFQFRTGFIAPSSRVFGRGELVEVPFLVAKRYLTSNFFIDVLSILPLPQIVVLFIIPSLDGPVSLVAKDLLKIIILCQYVPRIIRIFPLLGVVTRTSGILAETTWAGAVSNLCLYMLASHIIGAFWYLLSIERKHTCWRKYCKAPMCISDDLYCGAHRDVANSTLINFLNESCPIISPDDIKNSTVFNFGIFYDALESEIVESWSFPNKFMYCFWWGLRNLSALGQNLKTSTSGVEILFAIAICIAGLVLFSLLIGNMQKYLQSTTVRVEEMRVKRRDADQWMAHRMLPENLRERIRKYEQYKWQETRGVEEQTLIRSLPKDLRRDINRHLCFNLILRVPMLAKMDEQILDAICDRLRPTLYTKNSYIVREGDPVDEMLFIMRGDLMSVTTNGGRTGFFNAVYLKAGDFCGEGLLTWALDPQSTSNLPISSRTVQALTEVEAFALVAEDLKSVASQFRRLHHKDIQHTFRFFSVQWRTWATCFIQAAWRRYCRRRQAKSLREVEERLQDALAKDAAASPSLGATIYASQFAANLLKNMRQNAGRPPRVPQRLALVPQKPTDPDFSAHNH